MGSLTGPIAFASQYCLLPPACNSTSAIATLSSEAAFPKMISADQDRLACCTMHRLGAIRGVAVKFECLCNPAFLRARLWHVKYDLRFLRFCQIWVLAQLLYYDPAHSAPARASWRTRVGFCSLCKRILPPIVLIPHLPFISWDTCLISVIIPANTSHLLINRDLKWIGQLWERSLAQ